MGREKKESFDTLTESELEIMKVLWTRGESTVSEIQKELLEKQWAYTTVATLVKVLQAKSYVIGNKISNYFVYWAKMPRQVYESQILNKISKDVFENSPSLLVARLVQDEKISSEEIEKLRQLLVKAGEKSHG